MVSRDKTNIYTYTIYLNEAIKLSVICKFSSKNKYFIKKLIQYRKLNNNKY